MTYQQDLIITLDTAVGGAPDAIALENGDTLLLENGDTAVLEAEAIGEISVTGADIIPSEAATGVITLGTGAITVAGADVLASVAIVLDTGSITIAGSDLSAATQITFDTGSVTVAGNDLSANAVVALDTGALAVAGADVPAALVATLDTGAVAVAGADVTPLAAGTILLDTGAVRLPALMSLFWLHSLRCWTLAHSLLPATMSPPTRALPSSTGNIAAVARTSVPAALAVTLDVGTLAIASSDIEILAAKLLPWTPALLQWPALISRSWKPGRLLSTPVRLPSLVQTSQLTARSSSTPVHSRLLAIMSRLTVQSL